VSFDADLVSAADLHTWAPADARFRLPELIRWLILGSPAVREVSLRDEGVDLPGWDGRADAASGDPYLPEGRSWWELTTQGSGITAKANKDYRARTKEPCGAVPGESTFVFVSLRRWPQRDEWLADRRAEGVWSDVRAYDAGDLHGWLQVRPVAAAWFSGVLGRSPGPWLTLRQWWGEWAGETAPVVPPELLVAGRDADVAGHDSDVRRLLASLDADPRVVTVRGESAEESRAFVAASLILSGSRGQCSRTLVIRDRDAWGRAVARSSGLVLLPDFGDPVVGSAVKGGHHVIVPTGYESGLADADVALRPINRAVAAKILERAVVGRAEASRLAHLARQSVPELRRSLAVAPSLRRPWWSESATAPRLAPVLLVGAWDADHPEDQALVATVAGRPYDELERDLHGWAARDDRPVASTGGVWHILSKESGWRHLGVHLTRNDIDRYLDVAREVLSERDPALELPPRERFMAAVAGRRRRWSPQLRAALADTAAMLGARGTTLPDAAMQHHATTVARRLVRELLEAANADGTDDLWRSLSDGLPRLAEAAPIEFMDAIEQGLHAGQPLMGLFSATEGNDPLFGRSDHAPMLWAVETLCWPGAHMVRAARVLARLAEIVPQDISNSPLDSLWRVLLPVQPHTAGTLQDRRELLRGIVRDYPDVGWRLLVRMLPETGFSWHGTATPRWRDWVPENHPSEGRDADWRASLEQTTEIALDVARACVARFADLVPLLERSPSSTIDGVLGALESLDPSAIDPEARTRVWRSLARLADRCRGHPDAVWALPATVLQRVEDLAEGWRTGSTGIEAARWFVNFPPPLDGVDRDDYEAYDRALHEHRLGIVRELITVGGAEELLVLVEEADSPWRVGLTVAHCQSELAVDALLPLVGERGNAGEAAAGLVAGIFAQRGWDGIRHYLEESAGAWSVDHRVALVLAAPRADQVAVDLAALLGAGARGEYLRQVSPYAIVPDAAATLVPALLEAGRPWAAVSALAGALRHVGADELREVVVATLEQALERDARDEARAASLAHEVGVLLDALDQPGEEAQRLLASLEWAYHPLLERDRGTPALDRALGTDAEAFADVVCLAYPAEGEQEVEVSEDDLARARHAYGVLAAWSRIPGLRDDGSVDGDALARWLREARQLLHDRGRGAIADLVIGECLGASPQGSDGIWPAEAVRDVLEADGTDDLTDSMLRGKWNRRGVRARDRDAPGARERKLAAESREWAGRVEGRWSRTARMLERLAEQYERDAASAEETVERWADLG
jgi:hypothetical protein